MAGPDGIVWDDEAPAQAAPVSAASAADGIQWDTPPSFRNVRSGSDSRVNFDGVRAGSQSRVESLTPDVPGGDAYGYGGAMQAMAPMSQFAGIDPVGRVGQAVSDIGSAATTFEPYADLPGDERRRIGFGEGAARTFGEDILAAAPSALLATNPILAGANALYGRMTGNQTPLQRAEQGIHENVGVNENAMTFESPGAEFWSTMAGHAAGAAIPLGPAGEVRAGERAAAVAGHFGPEAQGAAVADDILASARPQEAAGARRAPEAAEVAPAPSAPMEVTELRPEDVPEAFRSKLGQQETPTVDATPEELAAFERQRAPAVVDQPTDPFQNNASGESAASIEAQSRRDQERAAGQSRMLIEANGEVIPLTGVDAVDAHARPGQVIVQRGIGDDPAGWTILSHGDNVPPRLAQGRVNASRARLDLAHAELTPEAPNAGEVRSNTGQPPVPREVRAGSEADRSGDLQQPAQARPSAGDGAQRSGANEPVRGEPETQVTSTKNAVVNAERRARGLAELDFEGRRAFGEEMWAKARTKFDADPTHAETLAREVAERPRPLSAEENASLILDRAHLNAERRDVTHEIEQAMAGGDTKAEMAARTRLDAIDERLEISDRAARQGGGETALGLGSRRMMTREDYAPGEVLVRAKVAKRGPLTPAERTRLEGRTKRLEKLDQRVDESIRASQPRTSRAAQAEFDSLAEQIRKIPKEKHMVCAS